MYRVAIIGCGAIAHAHARGYLANPSCQLVAAADIDEGTLARFCSTYNIPHPYTHYESMLHDTHPDLVSVCTWPPYHPAHVAAAAQAGARGILCEKPIALSLADADAMIATCTTHGAALIIGHQRRFEPRYALARELIATGTLGTIEEIRANCPGDLWSDATHSVDLLRFLTGDTPVAWVFGQIDLEPPHVGPNARFGYSQRQQTGFRYGHPIEGASIAQLQFADGCRALLETGRAARAIGYQRIQVTGSVGALDISGDPTPTAPAFLRLRTTDDPIWRDLSLPVTNPFAAEITALLATLETGAAHPLAASSARATLEILTAIMESAFQHHRLTLPITITDHPLLRRSLSPSSAAIPAENGTP